jgi:adenine-specific DNA-methyltransferase
MHINPKKKSSISTKLKKKCKFELIDSIQYIKYMGSKTKILPFVISGIEEVYEGGYICDLFAGSGTLSGALGTQAPIVSNDIQFYSTILSKAYLTDWNNKKVSSEIVIDKAKKYYNNHYKDLITDYQYPLILNLKEFNKIEKKNQLLIKKEFNNKWHLFTKFYSGTWWSAEQCAWIDSIRKVIEDFKDNPAYNTMLSSLMYAMAYNSQGTGHYAQYRDAKTDSSMKDILIYRRKSIIEYFIRKLESALEKLPNTPSTFEHKIHSLDYLDCLETIQDSTIYADPPYCFVHYSRFYHAIETLSLYDYPQIQLKNGEIVKGRYREIRHQSPFCINSKVKEAFEKMFKIIAKNNCSLVLSYSNTGMISIEELLNLARDNFQKHTINIKYIDHKHMTMGRFNDRNRDVKELLITVKRK